MDVEAKQKRSHEGPCRVTVKLETAAEKREGILCSRCNARDAPPHSDWLRFEVKLISNLNHGSRVWDTIARYLFPICELWEQAKPSTMMSGERVSKKRRMMPYGDH